MVKADLQKIVFRSAKTNFFLKKGKIYIPNNGQICTHTIPNLITICPGHWAVKTLQSTHMTDIINSNNYIFGYIHKKLDTI